MNNRLNKGLLIVFEGIDGTGKSTQLQLLHEALSHAGYPVISTREPTDSIWGKKIRALYQNRAGVSKEEELSFFIKDRKEHVESLILPAISDNKIILCDRYFLSTAAYQGAAGFDPEEILDMNSFAPTPDLAFLFEVPATVCIQRITGSRGDTLNDFEKLENLLQVQAIFAKLEQQYIHRIVADKPLEEVFNKVYEKTLKLISDHSS